MKVIKHLLISGFVAMAGLATVQAGPNLAPVETAKSSHSGIYIVQLKGDPVIAYDGDVAGFKATRPGKGKKLNPNSAHVRKYSDHLGAEQNSVIDSVGGEKVYSYRYAFNGFAARMSAADAEALRNRGDVLNVWKDEIRQIHTDGSPDYINLTEGGEAWSNGATGEDIVIGVVDTGIWPEHPSFADVPTYAKGNKGPMIPYDEPDTFVASGCDFGNTAANPNDAPAACNNKLVAARCYNNGFSSGGDPANPCGGNGAFLASYEFNSARDVDGHGSHVSGTAGGNYGVPAVIGGEFEGNVSGIAPRAYIAAYKVCWDDNGDDGGGGCASSDSAAAIDQAVLDGVDVINFSVGGSSTRFSGPDDIAFLFAADAGVWVATSNGNSGPGDGTVGTPAGVPWITAVGASQDDGVFYNQVTVNAPPSIAGDYDAVEGPGGVSLADAGPITDDVTHSSDPVACGPIDPISGIALVSRGGCTFKTKFDNAAAAGASAIIVYNHSGDPISMGGLGGTTIPGVMVSTATGLLMAGETGVNATLDSVNETSAANRIAGFSSRGPNGGGPDIIKPDISAPGVAILAAESPELSGELFQSINGTSMASPHVAGAFALLKQEHPDWSPAIARSALMTTARTGMLESFGDELASPFDVGAGEILPSDATDPGLAYHADFLDYVAFLCGEPAQAGIVSQATCDFLEGAGWSLDPSDLNLPSIGVASLVGSQTVTRTVTAVYNNNGNKTFNVSVDAPPGVDVSVSPSTIKLRKGDSASYEVTFTTTGGAVLDEWAFGSLTWTDTDLNYSVRSPIAVMPTAFAAPNDAAGTGTAGSLEYDVEFGYSGDFNASMDGLDEGQMTPGAVPDGDADLHFGQIVPPGTTLARFALYDEEIGAHNDLDMQVFGPGPAFPFVCSSGTATSNEECNLVNPAPGEYAVFVIDFASDAGPTPYILWLFNLDGTDAGNTTITAPGTAVSGTTGTVTIDWAGLAGGTRHLGIVSYDDGVDDLSGTTDVMINTQ
jgi:subtilisin family serine protease